MIIFWADKQAFRTVALLVHCQLIAESKQKTRSHSGFTDRINQFI